MHDTTNELFIFSLGATNLTCNHGILPTFLSPLVFPAAAESAPTTRINPSTYQRSTPKSRLLERSMEVAEEAASVLASVRMHTRPYTRSGMGDRVVHNDDGDDRDVGANTTTNQPTKDSNRSSLSFTGPPIPNPALMNGHASATRNTPSNSNKDTQDTIPPSSAINSVPKLPPSVQRITKQYGPGVGDTLDAGLLNRSTISSASSPARLSRLVEQANSADPAHGPREDRTINDIHIEYTGSRRSSNGSDTILPPTIEDVEHEISRSLLVDAACFATESLVSIRSNRTLRTFRAVVEDNPSIGSGRIAATLDGYGLGQPDEVLLLKVIPSNVYVEQDSSGKSRHNIMSYGDRIILQTTNSRGRGGRRGLRLGVVRQKEKGSFQVGFISASTTASTEWIVLRASSQYAVLLGGTATTTQKSFMGPSEPVRSGAPVILRHCETGGVLAVAPDSDTKKQHVPFLTIRLDSYDTNRVRHDQTSDLTLMGKLLHHDRLIASDAETFHFMHPTEPPTPLWIPRIPVKFKVPRRIFLEGSSYLLEMSRHDNDTSPKHNGLEKLPAQQEQILVDELIGSFLGLEGIFVRARSKSDRIEDISFYLHDPDDHPFDTALRSAVESMLQLSSSFTIVRDFVSLRLPGYEYGCVMHAVCAKIDSLLLDYSSFVTNLERQRNCEQHTMLSLFNLFSQVQPRMRWMQVLERIVQVAATKKGGALINALRLLKLTECDGDPVANELMQDILEAAARPYLEILGEWLERGVLLDPYNEFMVNCKMESNSWESRYELAAEHILEGFFATELTVSQVLATGRYWNAVEVCNRNQNCTSSSLLAAPGLEESKLSLYGETSSTVASFVLSKYQKASKAIVHLMLHTYDLLESLRLMKRYFLLDHGDFFIYFLDAAEDELQKDMSGLSRGRIQHWLEASIQRIERLEDGYTHGPLKVRQTDTEYLSPLLLRCCFASDSLADHLDKLHAARGGIDTHEPWTPLRHVYGSTSKESLTGIDTFLVDFTFVPFPTSLIVTQSSLDCYQLLFRHLFFAKYAERRLVGIWKDHQGMKELQSLRGSMGRTFLLRQRMLHFVQNLIYYMTLEVIEPHWTDLERFITSAFAEGAEYNIDDISAAHTQFLQHILEACLLTNRELVRALTKLMKTCLLFSDQMKLFMKATKLQSDRDNVASEKQKVVQRHLSDRRGAIRFSIARDELEKSIEMSRLERKTRIRRQTVRVEREITGESYPRMITRFDEVFSENLREFMEQLKTSDDLYHSQKVNLCIRLDYNGFVTRSMGSTFDSARP